MWGGGLSVRLFSRSFVAHKFRTGLGEQDGCDDARDSEEGKSKKQNRFIVKVEHVFSCPPFFEVCFFINIFSPLLVG